MNKPADTVSEMELLEQRVRSEAAVLYIRTTRLIQDQSLSGELVVDGFRRLWKFRTAFGLQRSVHRICLIQCTRHLQNTAGAGPPAVGEDILEHTFNRDISKEEREILRKFDPAAVWEEIRVLIDEDDFRNSSYRQATRRMPARTFVYAAGLLFIVLLFTVYYTTSPVQPTASGRPDIVVETGPEERTDLQFPNGVRVWLHPQTRAAYAADIETEPLQLTVSGEILLDVPLHVQEPVHIHSFGQVFYLEPGRYRMSTDRHGTAVEIQVKTGLAKWGREDNRLDPKRIPAGSTLRLHQKGNAWEAGLVKATEDMDW